MGYDGRIGERGERGPPGIFDSSDTTVYRGAPGKQRDKRICT